MKSIKDVRLFLVNGDEDRKNWRCKITINLKANGKHWIVKTMKLTIIIYYLKGDERHGTQELKVRNFKPKNTTSANALMFIFDMF